MNRILLAGSLAVLCAVGGVAGAEERSKAGPVAQQRRGGQQLLQKLVRVAREVPLMDASAVFRGFGFETVQYFPAPDDAGDVLAIPVVMPDQLLARYGFDLLTLRPWKSGSISNGDTLAALDGEIDTRGFCLARKDVEDVLGLPQMRNGHGQTYFLADAPVDGVKTRVVLEYEDQPCAVKVNIAYLLEHQGVRIKRQRGRTVGSGARNGLGPDEAA